MAFNPRWLGAALLLTMINMTVTAQTLPALDIPACTAYCEPDPDAVTVTGSEGVTGWSNSRQKLAWYGYIKTPGSISPSVLLVLPAGEISKFGLTIAGKRTLAEARGPCTAATPIAFDPVMISTPGYYRFELAGKSRTGPTFGDVKTLEITGAAATDAHFNLKERRNAASVHLVYSLPAQSRAAWFYNEVTVKTDPVWSYYMACGFRRGYFGIQVNSKTERQIIFSVWDSGHEGVDRSKVPADDQVQLLARGDGVFAGGFGNEGTGGHSHLIYSWKTGSTYRFLVSAEPDGEHTVYTGYFYFPEKRAWGLIARFRAPKDGNYLNGLYSFNENFGGANGQERRLAEFGNQWVKSAEGVWSELTTARFSHDETGKQDRLDYSSGVNNGRFYLSNGGFVANGVKFGDVINRSAGGKPPSDIVLPAH